MFYIYILKSQNNNSFYIGSCKNIDKRIVLHNSGSVKSTKRYAPWKLVYKEGYDTIKSARERELQIKSWKKRSAVEKIIRDFKI